MKLDRIEFEIIRSALYAVAREMKIAMMRTAASPVIHSGGDASAAIFDSEMQLVAQGNDIPTMMGSAVVSTRASVQAIGVENLRPGDVIVSNDAYLGGGNHQPDVQFTRPVFLDNEIIAYTMTRGHWQDIGGMSPNSGTLSTWDIFGEGLRIPPVILFRNDKPVPDLITLIVHNTRDPGNRALDIQAQYAGTYVGDQRVVALASKWGKEKLAAAMREALEYSERLMRKQIETIPDGEYEGSDFIEAVAEGSSDSEPVPIRVKITVKGDGITFDYTGSGPQVRGGVNCPLSVTCNSTWYTVKALTDPSIPINQGCYRPIQIIAPAGTILNCQYPASVVGGNTATSQRVIDMLLTALAPAVPNRVIAQSHGTAGSLWFGGDDPDEERCRTLRRRFVSAGDVNPGGMGARPDKDGVNAIRTHIGNAGTISVEQTEYTTPVRIESWNLVIDSGGAGRWRGGLTAERLYYVEYVQASCTVGSERAQFAPQGLFGGLPGSLYRCDIIRKDGPIESVPPKGQARVVGFGDRVRIRSAGAGGYGDPFEREVERVLADVRNEYVSIEDAYHHYGVAISADLKTIDIEATRALRSGRRAA
ncbi:MAG: hydantoinase B/oxoprolinase family protein [Pusillimonas sp.]